LHECGRYISSINNWNWMERVLSSTTIEIGWKGRCPSFRRVTLTHML
jgi:hypothetical protein